MAIFHIYNQLQQPAVRPIQIQSRKKPVTCPENKKDEKARSSNDKKSLRERPISKGGPGKSSPESSVEVHIDSKAICCCYDQLLYIWLAQLPNSWLALLLLQAR